MSKRQRSITIIIWPNKSNLASSTSSEKHNKASWAITEQKVNKQHVHHLAKQQLSSMGIIWQTTPLSNIGFICKSQQSIMCIICSTSNQAACAACVKENQLSIMGVIWQHKAINHHGHDVLRNLASRAWFYEQAMHHGHDMRKDFASCELYANPTNAESKALSDTQTLHHGHVLIPKYMHNHQWHDIRNDSMWHAMKTTLARMGIVC